MNTSVLEFPRRDPEPRDHANHGLIRVALERVIDATFVGEVLFVVLGLHRVGDLHVDLGAKDVDEDALEGLGVRGGGVLHTRVGRSLPRATPRLFSQDAASTCDQPT